MGFFISMFICNLLVPLIMLIGGILMYRKPPKQINDAIGYRTRRSKKNMDTWLFAHKYCGKEWTIVGAILLVASVAGQIPFAGAGENTVGLVTMIVLGVQVAVILLSIVPVERALERTFDDEGMRR